MLFGGVAAADSHLDAFIRAELLTAISIVYAGKSVLSKPKSLYIFLLTLSLQSFWLLCCKDRQVNCLLALKTLIWVYYKTNPILTKTKPIKKNKNHIKVVTANFPGNEEGMVLHFHLYH